jgi:threonine aldolase
MTAPAPSAPFIDLRSDTVTRPTAAMRKAIAEAEVGDDVFAEDPTVNRLEEEVALLLGTEAALFVPSGTMANQIAIRVHTQPGDEVLVGRSAHNNVFESGAAAAISGVQMTVLDGDGTFDGDQIRAAFKGTANAHVTPTRLVSIENTHNMGGGYVWPMAQLRGAIAAARELGLATHLDGARLWNAAVRLGATERALCEGFDTISVCLSKGLGAPVGSLLAGPRALIRRAHRFRKMFGGGMRQAGLLAAAGLHALEHHRARLADDHANAQALVAALADVPGLSIDRGRVHTNIVMIDVAPGAGSATAIEAACRDRGLRFVAMGPQRIRLVTHLDVDRAACDRAAAILRAVVGELRG